MNEQQREQAIRDIMQDTNLSLSTIEEADPTALRVGLDLPPDASMEQVKDRICEIGRQQIDAINARFLAQRSQ